MTPWVQRLLIANVVMFFVQQTVRTVTPLLEFVPVNVLTRPWSVITYMFLHGGLGHIFWNMLGLYFFGPRVEQRMGSNRFITLYLDQRHRRCSVVGGARAAEPDHRRLGRGAGRAAWRSRGSGRGSELMIWGIIPIEARWLVLIYAAIDLWAASAASRSGVANFAHLGGFAGALLYLVYLERRQGAQRFKKQATPNVPDPAIGNWRKVDTSSIHSVNREEVDRILDKINASGIGSLTPQERQFLSNFVPPDDRKPF